jgi:hypothetical protein
MKLLFTLFFLLCLKISSGQTAFYSNYDWDKNSKKYELNDEEKQEDEVTLYEKIALELFEKETGFVQYNLLHTITILNTNTAIESNNRMYIRNGANTKVLKQKARVIRPDGTVIELKTSDIQESKDEEGNVDKRYFALDGLEIGSLVEYMHYMEVEPTYSGSSMYLQSGNIKKNVELDIICPSHLGYKIYPINGMGEFTRDTIQTEINRMFLEAVEVPALVDEDWSAYSALLQKCYYKLHSNYNSRKSNFYTYTNVTKNIYEDMYTLPSKKAQKRMHSLAKEAKAADLKLEGQIRSLEYKLKSEFTVIDTDFEGSSDIDLILSRKVTSDVGLTKLMIQVLREMGVKYELVLTNDGLVDPFIDEFEGYNFLTQYLIYINDLDMYWDAGLMTRLGFPPYEYTFTNGLFIEERTIGDLKVGVGKVKYIDGPTGGKSIDKINTTIDFSQSISEPIIELERITTGYKAQYPQNILDFVDEDQKNTFKEDYLKYLDQEALLENITFENDNSKVGGEKPFIGSATFKGNTFVEMASNKILVKAGLLIGPQAQMYNEKERKLPVNSFYTRQYKRQITILVPDGYEVKNPEALNMDIKPEGDGSTGFVSTYKLEGTKIIVDVFEYYNKVHFTVEEYDEYQKVMNAAADFNKIILVMEKM